MKSSAIRKREIRAAKAAARAAIGLHGSSKDRSGEVSNASPATTENVGGLNGATRKYKVKDFIGNSRDKPDIIVVQEHKLDVFAMNSIGRLVSREMQTFCAPGSKEARGEGTGGTALLIHRSFKILKTGTSDDGYVTWAQIANGGHELYVASVYGPHSLGARAAHWARLRNLFPHTNVIMCGDWNMVKQPTDSSGERQMADSRPLCPPPRREYLVLPPSGVCLSGVKDSGLHRWQTLALGAYHVQVESCPAVKTADTGRGHLTAQQLVRLDWLETEKRIREHERDLEIRMWSRVKHLGLEDAPTKYFFNIHKQNAARAQILQLRLSSGEETRDQSRILYAVGKYYADLYTAQTPTPQDSLARQEIMCMVEDNLLEAERAMLAAPPTEKEIEDVLFSLPINKAPGVDGISAEAMRKTWPYMKKFYVNMVHRFWEEGVLAETVTEGMIRLIPKTVNKTELKDWRPLTMLNTDYKIIARILAGRLQMLLQKLVLPQQTGFIKGRHMLNNFITLVKGLTLGASMAVHVNGAKTYRFQVGRGVRQGCPLAPLLFVLATQPLMEELKLSFQAGRLRGYKVGDKVILDYSLFADDMGVFLDDSYASFQELKAVLAK
ncbi:hypothetical protein AXG93_815s1520 [Marchantia polymorpha subsp. ruderalis]|uniref:Uncharacterized protein n=1 Tax=Marchantia polymorpha subsp. ruderalis TaxID=1480154 RepID=A0A176W0B1_MARPO|nr:hypothetical protein AXG93_815s1520 [Marchantia polymorpha subsp. ruderalis]